MITNEGNMPTSIREEKIVAIVKAIK